MSIPTSPETVLNRLYHDPNNKVFLVKNSQKLYEAAKQDSLGSGVTFDDVTRFKQKIESISQTKASQRLGGGKNRGYSFRRYKLYGQNIISGDLAFIPPLLQSDTGDRKKYRVLMVLMDCLSRKVSLNFMPDAKSSTALKTFEKSLQEDFPNIKYTKFLSDRGY